MEDRRLVRIAQVTGANGAGVLVLRDTALLATAGSSELVCRLDALQAQGRTGPAADCVADGRSISGVTSSEARERWPALMGSARAEGVNSIAAFPVFHDRAPLGVLTLYFHRTSGPDPAQEAEAARLAPLVVLMFAREAAAERLRRATELVGGAVSRVAALDAPRDAELRPAPGASTAQPATDAPPVCAHVPPALPVSGRFEAR